MPADQEFQVTLGVQGLNFRDQPSIVGLTGFIDSLNWRLDQQGAPTKRLGYDTYVDTLGSTVGLPSDPTGMFGYAPSSSAPAIIATCVNGHTYSSPGDGTWTSIASGLSGTATPCFTIVNDVLYWTNGVDNIQSWDGSSHVSISSTPKGTACCTWRNRLWVSGVASTPHRVYWSNIADPATFQSLNYVDIFGPAGDAVTALWTAPNIGSGFEGADGVLVFTQRSTHRITNDIDNVSGSIVGGTNVLIDASNGCINQRTLATLNGIVYLVARDGIYATTGHSPLFLQSSKLGQFFTKDVNASSRANMVAVGWRGSYLLALTPTGSAQNTLVLEVYTTLPQDPHDRQHPIMALTIPAATWAVLPSASQGDSLYFADSTPTQTLFVRRYEQGGADTTDVATPVVIQAVARTGQSTFSTPHPKRVRRIQMSGRGNVLVGVSADFEDSMGESKSFPLSPQSLSKWGQGQWGSGKWGRGSSPSSQTRWYTKRGRAIGMSLVESSSATALSRGALGIPGQPTGSAAVLSAVVCITPLAVDS